MKTKLFHFFAAACCVATLCQCQYVDVATPKYRMISERKFTANGHYYVEQRRVVSERPLETQVIILER